MEGGVYPGSQWCKWGQIESMEGGVFPGSQWCKWGQIESMDGGNQFVVMYL